MAERNDEAASAAAEEVKAEEAENLSKEKDSNMSKEKDSKDVDICQENQVVSQQQEEEIIKKKYGGLIPKKPSLISKDNERAFFDSADWALGKKSKGPLEALRPKLQPTPHQHVRSRSAYSREDGGEDDCNLDDLNPEENQGSTIDGSIESNNYSAEHHHQEK